MAADLELLNPQFKAAVVMLVSRCGLRGFEMRPNNGLRDPFEQARLWRQSRSIEEITAKIAEFEAEEAGFLAHCLRSVGPQHGEHVTDAPPGFSWHQWGEALDCFWLLNGRAEWSTKKLVGGLNAYHVYAAEAVSLGLTAGGHWKKLKDWPHVQLRPDRNPTTTLSIREINAAMATRFGN